MSETIILAGGTNHGRRMNLLRPVDTVVVPRKAEKAQYHDFLLEPSVCNPRTETYHRLAFEIDGVTTRKCFVLEGADPVKEILHLIKTENS